MIMMQPDNSGESIGSTVAQIQQLWAKLDQSGRHEHLRWTVKHCPECGCEKPRSDLRLGYWTAFWCEACLDAMAKELNEADAERERKEKGEQTPL
jgi:hypothetical protein